MASPSSLGAGWLAVLRPSLSSLRALRTIMVLAGVFIMLLGFSHVQFAAVDGRAGFASGNNLRHQPALTEARLRGAAGGRDAPTKKLHVEDADEDSAASARLSLRRGIPGVTSELSLLPSKPRPNWEQLCGTWMRPYAAKHSEAMNQLRLLRASAKYPDAETLNKMGKFIVFRCRQVGRNPYNYELCGGLADRFKGMVSTLMLSIFMNRTLLVDWPGSERTFGSPLVQYAFDNTIYGGPRVDKLLPQMPGVPGNERQNFGANVSALAGSVGFYSWHNCWHVQCGIYGIHGSLDKLRTMFPERVLFINFNRDLTPFLWGDNYTRPIMESMKLPREDHLAQGCLLRFLLRPTLEVQRQFQPYLAILNNPVYFCIGIHIRAGDRVMEENRTVALQDLDKAKVPFRRYFEAAQLLESQKAEGRITKWLFLTDSSSLRDVALKAYGSKIMVTHVQPTHIQKVRQRVKFQEIETVESITPRLQEAFGEWWLLSKCDYFVMRADKSGFSATAAAYSLLPTDRIIQPQ
eukprot:jgi/Chlat1/682/Chrsp104S01159